VTYAVGQGDNRGVYMITSTDRGATWSEPTVVFDGAAAGWEVVAEPKLSVSSAGDLHVFWLHGPLPTSVRGNELYYSRSADGGGSWSPPERVNSAEQEDSPIVWHSIAGFGEKIVYRAWQEWIFGRLNIWSQQSFDGGVSWSEPAQVAVLEELNMPTVMITDGIGQAHLFYSTSGESGSGDSRFVINHRVWRDNLWQEEESLIPDRRSVSGINALAAVSQNTQLSVLFSASIRIDEIPDEEKKEAEASAALIVLTDRLYHAARQIELPGVLPTPVPQTTPTPTPTVTPDVTPTAEPTPTLVFPTDAGQQPRGLLPGQPNEMTGIIIGLGVAAILVAGLFAIIGVNRFRSSKARR
jgi:hypothetical protein